MMMKVVDYYGIAKIIRIIKHLTKLTILADTSNNYEDGPSPRFLRPQPTTQSFSPDNVHSNSNGNSNIIHNRIHLLPFYKLKILEHNNHRLLHSHRLYINRYNSKLLLHNNHQLIQNLFE